MDAYHATAAAGGERVNSRGLPVTEHQATNRTVLEHSELHQYCVPRLDHQPQGSTRPHTVCLITLLGLLATSATLRKSHTTRC